MRSCETSVVEWGLRSGYKICDGDDIGAEAETERECEITCRLLTAQFDIDITEVFLGNCPNATRN